MLVKFTNYQYIDSIIKGRIKSSFSSSFNDPFDSRLIIDEKSISQIATDLSLDIDAVKFHIKMINSAQISSFTKCDPFAHENSMLMWAHYADSGKNLAVCFDDDVITGKNSPYNKANFDVQYSKSPVGSSKTIIDYINARCGLNKQKQADVLLSFYKQKSEVWKYESEFRVLNLNVLNAAVPKILACGNDNKNAIRILNESCNDSDSSSLSFLKLGKPQKIIMGYDFDLESEKSLIELCQDNSVGLSKAIMPVNFSSYIFEEKIILPLINK